ncbi:hypothetical protein KSS87_021619 [Heliosperma pusillum]|nr:hypothetical protein KSS87_021619 [Heliosperma pusillum]
MVRVMKPAWLESLMEETTFFAACANHEARRKNEKNIFCLTCCLAFCPHCLPSHRSHLLLQVRRYVYHDVIRLDDLQKLIDCSYIQVNHMVYHGEDLSCILYRFDESDFTISQFEGLSMEMSDMNDDAQTIENSMLEEPLHHKGSSCSSNAISSSIISEEHDILRRKNKTNGFIKGIFISLNNRRKGAPHRSPLS